MSLGPVAGAVLWLLLTVVGVGVWRLLRRPRGPLRRSRALVAVLVGEGLGTAAVAYLGASGRPLPPPWSWGALGVAGAAAVVGGAVVTTCVLALADAGSGPAGPRVQRTILRGGTWIGALERLALTAMVIARWPDGVVAIVAVKAFARYPELKAGQNSGATERFIIGTFASLGWAAVCAGTALVLT